MTQKTRIVYRLQSKVDKTGPYRSETTSTELTQELVEISGGGYFSDEAHPTPQHDGIDSDKITDSWVCGCNSLEQLKAWFGDSLSHLIQHGFEILKMEVPANQVWEGKHQLVFCPKHAKEISIVNIN